MPNSGGPMTEAMYYILLALLHPNHGYQLMNAIAAVSGGRLKMGPGTLYGVLTRLQKEGLITMLEEDGRRKVYAVTDTGKEALRQEWLRLCSMVEDGKKQFGGDGNGN